MSAAKPKYSVARGFGHTDEKGKQTFYTRGNEHLVEKLPEKVINAHLKAGNITETERGVSPHSIPVAPAATAKKES